MAALVPFIRATHGGVYADRRPNLISDVNFELQQPFSYEQGIWLPLDA